MDLQFGELADGPGDIVQPAREGGDVDLAPLRNDPPQTRDLAFEALDLPRLAHRSRQ